MPKTRYRRTSRKLTKEHISSAHYNFLSTTQRPRQTPCIIKPQDTNRMYQPISKLAKKLAYQAHT